MKITAKDKQFMREAIRLADESVKHGGGPFGAVIVRDGEIVAGSSNSVTIDNAASIWGAALLIQKNADAQSAWLKAHRADCSKEEKAAYKARERGRRKRVLVLALVLNFGVLCAFKYVHFLLAPTTISMSIFARVLEKETPDIRETTANIIAPQTE